MPTEGPSSDDCRLESLPPTVPEPLPENSRSASDGSGWAQVSARCLVCERKFKVWVPDTPQNERDASETVMTRLKQHLWSVYEEHSLSEGEINNMLKDVQVDVQEHEDDKPPEAKIIRKTENGQAADGFDGGPGAAPDAAPHHHVAVASQQQQQQQQQPQCAVRHGL